jgi:plastocyanin
MRFLLLIGLASGVLAAAGCGSGSGETSQAAATGGSGGGKTVAVSAKEFSFDPGTLQIDKPGTYTFQLTNDGSFGHALEVEGQGVEEETDTVSPGSTGSVTITFSKTGSYEFYCPIDGHRQKGMEGTLTVGAASAGGAGTTEDNGGGSTDTGGSGGYGYG